PFPTRRSSDLPDPRPAVLDRVGQWVPALAHRADDRPAGDRDAMASRLASPPMDSPFDADALGSGTNRLRDPYAGRQDGVGQPVVGRTAHSWRISQTGRRRIGTNRVEAAS